MKIQTKSLKQALADCAPVVRLPNPTPIRGIVRFDGTQLWVTSLTAWISRLVDGVGDCSFCVNYGKFKQVVDQVSGEEIELAVDGGKLSLKSGSYSMKLPLFPENEFPAIGSLNVKPIAASLTDVADAIEQVAWSADDGKTRPPAYSNILLKLEPKALWCVASRSVVSAFFHRALICGDKELVIPANLAMLLVPALREEESSLLSNDRYAVVKSKSGTVAVQLFNGQYLKWESVQGLLALKNGKPKTLVDVDALKRACMNARIVTDTDSTLKKTPALEMDQADGRLTFIAGDNDDYLESITSDGEKSNSRFNAEYLSEALNVVKGPKLEWVAAENGVFFTGGDTTTIAIGLLPRR